MGTKINKDWSISVLVKNFLKNNIWLIVIFLFALILRIYQLDKYPDGFDEDEMALGYYAYSLIQNGADEYGNKFPIYFKSVGDYKYGLYSYFATIPVSLMGLTIVSTRLTAAVFGSLSIVALYFLTLLIFKDKKLSLIASLLLAINPTHIHFSRIGYSNVFGSFWALLVLIFLIKILKDFKVRHFFLGLFALLASIYSYQAYRVIVPVMLLITPLFYLKDIKKDFYKKMLFPILGVVIIALSFINPVSRARSSTTSSLVDTPALIENFSEDNFGQTKLFVTRMFHNKLTIMSLDFIKRYLSYFDLKFLFVETSSSSGRHITPGVGLLLLIELPFFIFGLSKIKSYVPLLLLVVSILPAAIVSDGVSTTRALFMVYPFSIISASGVYHLVDEVKNKSLSKLLTFGVITAYLLNFSFFIHQYRVHKTYHHPWYTDVGLLEMVKAVNKNIESYEKVVVSKGHYMPFLFVNKSLSDKLIFNMPYDCPPLGQENVLYVCFGYKVPKAARVVEVFRFKDQQPAIFLTDFNEKQEGSLSDKRQDILPDKMAWGDEVPTYKLDEKDYWPTGSYR